MSFCYLVTIDLKDAAFSIIVDIDRGKYILFSRADKIKKTYETFIGKKNWTSCI